LPGYDLGQREVGPFLFPAADFQVGRLLRLITTHELIIWINTSMQPVAAQKNKTALENYS
jgi:hypothetical protein